MNHRSHPREPRRGVIRAAAAAAITLALALASGSAAGAATASTPFGSLDAVAAASGGVRVSGWAIDPDASGSSYVWIDVSGSGRPVSAAATRTDVAAAYPAYGSAHGFDVVLPAGGGSQTVCVTAIDTQGRGNTSLGCRTVTVPTRSPQGNVESVSAGVGTVTLRGWALDPDTTASTYIWVDVSGSGRAVLASGSRPDVGAAFGLGPNHGFSATIPANGGAQRVCVTAVNVASGSNTSLGCRSVTVPSGSPIGALDAVTGSPTGVNVSGWALDPDARGTSYVWVDVSGSGQAVAVGQPRPDVQAAYGTTGSTYGFGATIGASTGWHRVCVTAVNSGAGSNTSLGCRDVLVASAGRTATGATPGATNTGVTPGTSLRVHNGDLVVTTPGAVIDSLDVRGFIDVRAPGVTIRNTVVRGYATSSSRALVTVSSTAYSLTIEDSELAPLSVSPSIDGLRGMNITARRLNIHHVIDQLHVYGPNVTLVDSWLHDNAHFTSDPNWGGTPSHDDNVQIQRGSDIVLRNNVMTGSHNAAIMLTQDAGQVARLTVVDNVLDGGTCTVNVKNQPTAPVSVSFTDNTFGRAAKYPSCGFKVPNTSYVLDLQRNYFTDGTTVPRTP